MVNDFLVGVCSRSFSLNGILRQELLNEYKNIKFNETGRSLKGPELIEFLRGCQKAIVALETIDETILSNLPELKVIGKYGVGLDKIDFEAMDKHKVQLGWTAGVNAHAVAELTMALILITIRNISKSHDLVLQNNWKQISGLQLSSLKVGVLGCGHVGKALIRLLSVFGCAVIAHDIADQGEFYRKYNVQNVSMNELLSQSDVLTVHIPKNSQTSGLLDQTFLKKMKDGSFLINTARGGLVDEQFVLEMLNSGHLRGAAFDVFENEPPTLRELIEHPHFFATSHIGGSSEEAILAMGRAAIRGLKEFKPAGTYA